MCFSRSNRNLMVERLHAWDFSGGSAVKNVPANARNRGSIPVLGRSHLLRGNKAYEPQLHMPWSLCPTAREITTRSLGTTSREQPAPVLCN